jgi:hypothetical protein
VRARPEDTITQLAVCLLRRADGYRLRELGIDESDGPPDEKEAVRSANHLVTKLHDGAVKYGLGVRREFPA